MTKATQKPKTEIIPRPENYISKPNSKMPCRSWDLPAGETCPGSLNSDGSIDEVCKKCYAKKGTFVFRSVRQVRANNKLAWKNKNWVDEMIKALDNDRYFRFFASGDGYELELWNKIYEVVKASEHCYFWIPTRMFKFAEFRPIIDKLNDLPNCVVRFSSGSLTGQIIDGAQTSTVIKSLDDLSTKMSICTAYITNGKCGDCRKCWSKKEPVIAYLFH